MKAVLILMALLCAGCQPQIVIDPRDNCQYFYDRVDHLSPRLDANGKQICEVKK